MLYYMEEYNAHSSNNALFTVSVNMNGFTWQWNCMGINGVKMLSVFINDGYTESVLLLL